MQSHHHQQYTYLNYLHTRINYCSAKARGVGGHLFFSACTNSVFILRRDTGFHFYARFEIKQNSNILKLKDQHQFLNNHRN